MPKPHLTYWPARLHRLAWLLIFLYSYILICSKGLTANVCTSVSYGEPDLLERRCTLYSLYTCNIKMTNGTPPPPQPSSSVVQRQIIGAFSAGNISRIICAAREIFYKQISSSSSTYFISGIKSGSLSSILKVLSSEMDLAKSGLIQKIFIKGRGAEIFRKIGPPPSCESSLKIPRHLGQLLAIRILIPNAGMNFFGAIGIGISW